MKYIHTQLLPTQSQYCTNSLPVYPYRRAGIFHCMCTRPIINDIIQLTIPILTIARLTLTDVCILHDPPSNERLSLGARYIGES